MENDNELNLYIPIIGAGAVGKTSFIRFITYVVGSNDEFAKKANTIINLIKAIKNYNENNQNTLLKILKEIEKSNLPNVKKLFDEIDSISQESLIEEIVKRGSLDVLNSIKRTEEIARINGNLFGLENTYIEIIDTPGQEDILEREANKLVNYILQKKKLGELDSTVIFTSFSLDTFGTHTYNEVRNLINLVNEKLKRADVEICSLQELVENPSSNKVPYITLAFKADESNIDIEELQRRANELKSPIIPFSTLYVLKEVIAKGELTEPYSSILSVIFGIAGAVSKARKSNNLNGLLRYLFEVSGKATFIEFNNRNLIPKVGLILPEDLEEMIKKEMQREIEEGKFIPFIVYGPGATGKTTLLNTIAKDAIAKERMIGEEVEIARTESVRKIQIKISASSWRYGELFTQFTSRASRQIELGLDPTDTPGQEEFFSESLSSIVAQLYNYLRFGIVPAFLGMISLPEEFVIGMFDEQVNILQQFTKTLSKIFKDTVKVLYGKDVDELMKLSIQDRALVIGGQAVGEVVNSNEDIPVIPLILALNKMDLYKEGLHNEIVDKAKEIANKYKAPLYLISAISDEEKFRELREMLISRIAATTKFSTLFFRYLSNSLYVDDKKKGTLGALSVAGGNLLALWTTEEYLQKIKGNIRLPTYGKAGEALKYPLLNIFGTLVAYGKVPREEK